MMTGPARTRIASVPARPNVTGAWPGGVPPYSVPALPIPSHFGETLQRKADHFLTLLAVLKALALALEGGPPDTLAWRQRAHAAIAKAEAIMSTTRDPD